MEGPDDDLSWLCCFYCHVKSKSIRYKQDKAINPPTKFGSRGYKHKNDALGFSVNSSRR